MLVHQVHRSLMPTGFNPHACPWDPRELFLCFPLWIVQDIQYRISNRLPNVVAVPRVPTIDGEVEVAVKPGTQHGDRMRLRGKGAFMEIVGRPDQRGDQFIRMNVSLPRSITSTQRELLQEFAKERDQQRKAA